MATSNISPQPLMLTNTGHKRLIECRRNQTITKPEERLMETFERFGVVTIQQSSMTERLLAKKWIKPAVDTTAEAVLTAYARNPLQYVERINFEVTTLCNFRCKHCRNGGVQQVTEHNIKQLELCAEQLLQLGIRRFDYIGGEVSKFGNGWLELSSRIRDLDKNSEWLTPLTITLYTNGWWLEKQQFEACGIIYANDRAYLEDMQKNGVTHVLFSIDGPEDIHDAWRDDKGLYQRILRSLSKVHDAGIEPRLSVVIRSGEREKYLNEFAEQIYGTVQNPLSMLINDPTNHFSNFIDSARGSDLRLGYHKLNEFPSSRVRCKAFFRPWPTLRIMANGEIGICPLMQGQEGYGNIHENLFADLLNNIQDAPLYKLHASGEIANFLHDIDLEKIDETYDHPCSVRRAVNLAALKKLNGS